MTLDADAAAVASGIKAALPMPVSEIGVDGLRQLFAAMAAQAPPPMPIFSVRDYSITARDGYAIPVREYKGADTAGQRTVVFVHGGGWVAGTLETADGLCRALAEKTGSTVVSVDYRLAPEFKFPQPVLDCCDVVQFLAQQSDDQGRHIALLGDSAGASIAAAVGLLVRDSDAVEIGAQVLVYPATEFGVERPSIAEYDETAPIVNVANLQWFWEQYLSSPDDASNPLATPVNAASFDGLAPTFVLTAEHDIVRDDGENFAKELSAAGVDVTLKRYDGVFHGFVGMVGAIARADEAVADIVDFLTSKVPA